MRLLDFYSNRKVKNFFKILSITIIFSTLLMACGVDSIMAAEKSKDEQIKAAYSQMQSAYDTYIKLLGEGRENSAEGNEAFSNYAKLKAEYESLTGLEVQQSPGEKNAVNPIETAVQASSNIAGKVVNEVTQNVLPGSSKQMSLLEKVAWSIGKSIIPTAAVLAFASLTALPLGAVVLGSIAIGAVSSGFITYLFEKRSNKFRDTKKTNMEIMRDVSVSAVVDGIMAPFTMATAGLASTFGNASAKVIVQNALRGAAIQFAGQSISAGAGGLVKHEWSKNYFHYDQQINQLQNEANKIFLMHSGPDSKPLSAEETKRLQEISQKISDLKAQDYNITDFRRDIERAAVSSAISGVIGTSVSGIAANTKAANLLSVKLFGNTSKAGVIANFVTSNPVSFLQGSSRAVMDKYYLSEDMKKVASERDKFLPNSVPYNYYNQEISRLKSQQEAINPIAKGAEAAVVNFAVQSVSVGVMLGKEKLVDKPRRDNAEIQERYRAQNSEWQKAAEARKKMEDYKAQNQPDPKNYTDVNKYAKDKVNFNRELSKMEANAMKLEVQASEAQSAAVNQQALSKIKQEYKVEKELDRNLEYSRILGQENYLKVFKAKMKMDNPECANMTDAELTAAAKSEISAQNRIAYENAKKDIDEVNSKLDAYSYAKGQAKSGGSDVNVNNAVREVAEGKREFTADEIKALEIQAAQISPSTYKAKIVNLKVSEMKANGATDAEILKASDKIYAAADQQMLEKYGNSWLGVMRSELIAKQISNIKYDDEGQVNLAQRLTTMLRKDMPQKVESEFVSHYKTQVNTSIKDQLLPVVNNNLQVTDSNDLGSIFINTVVSKLFDKVVIEEGSNKIFDGAYSGIKNSASKPIENIQKNKVTSEEMKIINQNKAGKSRIGD
ncbi:MAG: hypothetical protein QMC67_15820 [Candidatus Wallbacteria bacterium]